jgi:hypothetical protein
MRTMELGKNRLYVVARRALLDALDALIEQRDAVILVGAQAVYLRSGTADLQVALYTKDADLGIDPTRLSADPHLEKAMADAGFTLSLDRADGQPGTWLREMRSGGATITVPVDLLVPEAFGGGGRRGARIAPHDRRAARKVPGLEPVLLDNEPMRIESLEPDGDPRSTIVKVAGVAALLVAKAYKIKDRLADPKPDRLGEKDATDVLRLMLTSDIEAVVAVFRRLLADPEIGPVTKTGLGYLDEQFGRPRGRGVLMAQRNLEGVRRADLVAGVAVGYVRQVLTAIG